MSAASFWFTAMQLPALKLLKRNYIAVCTSTYTVCKLYGQSYRIDLQSSQLLYLAVP